MGVDGGSSGGDCLEDEVAVTDVDMKSVLPHVFLSNKGWREFRAAREGDVVGGGVVGVDVGSGGGEKRRSLDEGDLRRREVSAEELDDL